VATEAVAPAPVASTGLHASESGALGSGDRQNVVEASEGQDLQDSQAEVGQQVEDDTSGAAQAARVTRCKRPPPA